MQYIDFQLTHLDSYPYFDAILFENIGDLYLHYQKLNLGANGGISADGVTHKAMIWKGPEITKEVYIQLQTIIARGKTTSESEDRLLHYYGIEI